MSFFLFIIIFYRWRRFVLDKTYSVILVDNFHIYDDEGTILTGFETIEIAREFAKRYVCDSLEAFRSRTDTNEELRSMWYSFGEDAQVIDDGFSGGSFLDAFIYRDSTEEQRDWQALRPKQAWDETPRNVSSEMIEEDKTYKIFAIYIFLFIAYIIINSLFFSH